MAELALLVSILTFVYTVGLGVLIDRKMTEYLCAKNLEKIPKKR